MARARNIKPGFYLNEDLAQCSLMARFIFPGLWMMADKKGRLEDRPLRIKAAILPYDNANMGNLLTELEEAGMILRYEFDGQKYIQIVNFEKHQTPHYKEAESTIPGPDDKPKNPGFNGQSSKPKPEAKTSKDEVDRGQNPSDSLIPDSLIPDNGFVEESSSKLEISQGDALTPPDWYSWFNQHHGTNYSATSNHDRKTLHEVFTRWTNAGITAGQVNQAIDRARRTAKGRIVNLPVYVDQVLISMDAESASANAASHKSQQLRAKNQQAVDRFLSQED